MFLYGWLQFLRQKKKIQQITIPEQKQDQRMTGNSGNSFIFSHICQKISLLSLALKSSHLFLPKELKMKGMFCSTKSLPFIPGLIFQRLPLQSLMSQPSPEFIHTLCISANHLGMPQYMPSLSVHTNLINALHTIFHYLTKLFITS